MKLRFAAILALIALVLSVGVAEAGFREGLEAYRAGDHRRAAELWTEAAEDGDPAAQRNLGLMYLNGVGVARDPARALRWFERAAGQGFAPAAANLAGVYLKGSGVKADPATAFRYMKQAAEGGHAESMYNLGVLYQHGLGVEPDRAAAVHWYRRAARAGYDRANAKLAELGPEPAGPAAAQTDAGADAAAAPDGAVAEGGDDEAAPLPEIAGAEPAGDGLVDRLVLLFSPVR